MPGVRVVRALSSALGMEIQLEDGPDLDAEGIEEFRSLFGRHHLLLVRGVELTSAQQRGLVGHLGPVLDSQRTSLVSNLADGGILSDYELAWHSDLAFVPEPTRGISLYGLDVGQERTSTRFANGVRAYQLLPRDLKNRLEGLRAVHVNTPDKQRLGVDADATRPFASHPLVLEHPLSALPILYATEGQTIRITGCEDDGESLTDSAQLLEQLLERLYQPDNVYEHWWRDDDLLVWDNLALQHSRSAVPKDIPRTLQRVVLAEKDLEYFLPGFRSSRYAGG